MESLALMVFVLFCAVFLCGPLAVLLAVNKLPILAVMVAACACWLGIYWFLTVYTWARYLGLASVACGLYAMYHVAQEVVRT
jgi:hypothetical protein